MEVGRFHVYRLVNYADGGNAGIVLMRILCSDDQREIRDELASRCSDHGSNLDGQYYMGIAGDGEIIQMAMKLCTLIHSRKLYKGAKVTKCNLISRKKPYKDVNSNQSLIPSRSLFLVVYVDAQATFPL